MRLSKQERIAVLVIAVIIILGLGIFLFIVPQFKNIGTDNASLDAKKQELETAKAKAATRVDLGEQVYDAYKQGENIADMFFEEMKPYEADDQIRDFIQFCKDQGVNCSVDSITIGTPGVSELGVTFNEETEITYDLKVAARGDSDSQDLTEEQQRTAILQEALANTQAVGSIDVTFTVTALEPETLIDFIDVINEYKVGGVRKAMRLSSGFELEFPAVQEKYDKIVDDMQVDLTYDALKEIADENGKKFPSKQEVKVLLGLEDAAATGEDGAATTNNTNTKENDWITEIGDDEIFSLDVTITMYSLERMQDPTDKLAQQDQSLIG